MTKAETKLQQLLAGAQKDLPATSAVDIDGQEMKQSDIVAKLQSWIQLYEQKNAAKASAGSAVQALNAASDDIRKFRTAFGQALRQVFGRNSTLLPDFGLSITQRKTPSSETQVLAKAKNKATRVARMTLGKQQKKLVKGAPVISVTVPSGGDPAAVVAELHPSTGVSSTEPVVSESTVAPAVGPAPNGGGGK